MIVDSGLLFWATLYIQVGLNEFYNIIVHLFAPEDTFTHQEN